MNCSNPNCNRGIGLVSYRRGWFSKLHYCSKHCRDAFVPDPRNPLQEQKTSILRPFAAALSAFAGFATLTMTVLAAPPARPEAPQLPGCDRNLAIATASVAAMQARKPHRQAAGQAHRVTEPRSDLTVTRSAILQRTLSQRASRRRPTDARGARLCGCAAI